MNPAIYRTVIAGVCMLAFGLSARAAGPVAKGEAAKPAAEQSSIDKLVANQPAKPGATSNDAASDKPMTVNFSDFVKDGAGCGVPNLDTSNK
jgi:hypothetical protein